VSDGLGLIASLTLGAALVIAGASKVRDLDAFVIAVLNYDLLPRSLARAFARILPFAELACGVLLVVQVGRVSVAMTSAALLLTFLIAVSVNLIRGRSIQCHCFGSSAERIGWTTVVRLIVLLACASVLVAAPGDASPRRSDLLPAALVAAGVLLGLYVLGTAPEVVRLWRSKGNPAPTRHGGRVSFRSLPVVPIAIALKDRTAEKSRCGACP
jgi:hypothetical protein